ncbi:MAG TPA: DUF4249 domain-containing protein [Flavilitoribacter sp.]|nr:DUF4249 domain-containing protein [Flavilitoribacter sp.]HMQ86910.1 DUF4249 domain-containing protein [Flavilitoribacter sp.]
MKLQHLIFFLAALSLAACTERIDIKLDNEDTQRLVVDAWLTDEAKAHKVQLTLTGDYFSNIPPEPVTGAVVRITDGAETFDLTEASPGIYLTADNVKGIPGHTYTLTIDWEGQTYEAVSALREVAPIDKVETEKSDFQDEDTEETEYSVLLYTVEPPTEGDAYFWKAFLVDSPTDLTRTYWEIAEDKFVNGSPINGAEVLIIGGEPEDEFVFEQYNISQEAYDFFVGVQTETRYKGGIFDTPPANIPTNLNNGALGFFVAAGVVRDTVVIK